MEPSERGGFIRLSVQPNLFGRGRARVRIDDRPVPSSLGTNDFPVPPGPSLVVLAAIVVVGLLVEMVRG